MDSQPKAPDDPELKNIIDKLANFVARNGPEFEKMTKHKQMNNPKFNFLYGGEFFNYYQCKVSTEQQFIHQRKEKLAQQQAIIQDVITQQSIQSAPWQQQQQTQQPPHPPPPMPTPPTAMQAPPTAMPQPPSQMVSAPPWQQQPPPGIPPPPLMALPQTGPHQHQHQAALQQQQQQLQIQQQQLQQQIQAEKEKQELLLKERQKEREEQELQIQREREQLQAQIKESEENLQKQHEVFMLQQEEQIKLGIVTARDQQVQMLAKELEVDLSELESRLQAIIDSCTKDAIASGKLWIFSTAKTDAYCKLISRYLLHKIIPEGTPFEAKLHLIYLINDVTHHCVRRGAENLQQALGQVVGPIFCSTYICANDDKKKKLEKVLKLWDTNKYFDSEVMNGLKTPEGSMAMFQTTQLEEYADIVKQVQDSITEQLLRLQKQHDEFVEHISSMTRMLDARAEKLAKKDSDVKKDSDDSQSDGGDGPASQLQPVTTNIPIMGTGGMPAMIPSGPGAVPPGSGMPPGPGMPPVPMDPSAMAGMFPGFDPTVPPPGFGVMPGVPFQPGMLPPNFPPPQPGMPPPIPMMPPPPHGGGPPMPPILDFSKPPPGFGEFPNDFPPDFNPNALPPDVEMFPLDPNDPSLMPRVPYFDLPAGLMAPLVKLEDTEYEPLDPEDIRLPPPQPPSKRLLAAVEAFYAPPSREAPRNSEGWEQNGLFEFFKAKQKYSKLKKERFERDGLPRRIHVPSPIHRDRSLSRSPTPQPEDDMQRTRRRYRSRSRSLSRSRSQSPVRHRRSPSRSRSRSPVYRRRSISRSPPPPRRRNRSQDMSLDRSRDRSRSRSRSHTPPRRRRERSRSPSPDYGIQPFYQTNVNTKLGEENKGALLMKKMGWGGQGLGAREQGIVDPVAGGEVREKMDMYRGVGVEINDPFENFRKNKSSSFISRMKARAKSGK